MENTLPPVEIRFFGAFDLHVRGETVGAFRSRRVAIVLLILLKAGGSEVSRSYIAGQVWPESNEVQALANLRQSLMDLRKALREEAGRLIAIDRRSLRFESEDVVCDYSQFQIFEKSHRPERWADAVALYRGSLLPGLNQQYVDADRESLERRCLRLLERLLDEATLSEERNSLSLRILEIDPTHERAACVVIRDRAQRGDTAGMIRAFQEVRGALRRLLGLPPSQSTSKAYSDALALLATQREQSELSEVVHSRKEFGVDTWQSLTEDQKEFLKRISVFPGPFSLAEIDAMFAPLGQHSSDWMPSLARLVQLGYVDFSASSLYGPYSVAPMLEKIAECQADENCQVAFMDCMVVYAEKGYEEFSGPAQRVWLERFECQKENLRAAFRTALTFGANPNYAYRFAASITNFFMLSEGSLSLWDELTKTTQLCGGDPILRAKALNAVGFRGRTLNQLGLATKVLDEALALAKGDEHLCALIQTNQGMVCEAEGNLSEAKKLFKQALKSFQEHGNRYWQTVTEQCIAELDSRLGIVENLEQTLLRHLDVYHQLGDDLQLSSVRMSLSRIYLNRRQLEEARIHQSIAHATIQRLPWRYKQVYSLIHLSEIELVAVDHLTSEAYAREALKLAEVYALPPAKILAQGVLIQCAINTGRFEEAEALIRGCLSSVIETKMSFQIARFVEMLSFIRVKQSRFDEALSLLSLGWGLRREIDSATSAYPVSILRVLHELKLAGIDDDFSCVAPYELDSLLA